MSDSLERLYHAVIAARDLDPATSRTARLFQRGPSKMAKKVAEEAIEVAIDAVSGNTDAMIRESADLFYNLAVLWAAVGIRPTTSGPRWTAVSACSGSPRSCRKRGETGQAIRKTNPAAHRHARRPSSAQAPLNPAVSHGQIRRAMVHRAMLRRTYDWCIAAADKPYALWILGAVAFAESSFFPVPPDIMLLPMALARPQRAWLFASLCTIASVAGGVLGYAIGSLLYDSLGQWLIASLRARRQGRGVSRLVCAMGRLDHHRQGPDADPLQARHHHLGLRRI